MYPAQSLVRISCCALLMSCSCSDSVPKEGPRDNARDAAAPSPDGGSLPKSDSGTDSVADAGLLTDASSNGDDGAVQVDLGLCDITDAGPPTTRHTAKPLGSTIAPHGFYEYISPCYRATTPREAWLRRRSCSPAIRVIRLKRQAPLGAPDAALVKPPFGRCMATRTTRFRSRPTKPPCSASPRASRRRGVTRASRTWLVKDMWSGTRSTIGAAAMATSTSGCWRIRNRRRCRGVARVARESAAGSQQGSRHVV
jgi:hypothetical protein